MEMGDETASPPSHSLRNRHLHKTFTGSNITISEAEMRSLPNLYMDREGQQLQQRCQRHPNNISSSLYTTSIPPPRVNRYVQRSSHGRTRRGYSSGYHHRPARPRVLNTLRKSAKFVFIPEIKDINIVDRYSRIIFPVSFVVFNVCYWSFYFLQ